MSPGGEPARYFPKGLPRRGGSRSDVLSGGVSPLAAAAEPLLGGGRPRRRSIHGNARDDPRLLQKDSLPRGLCQNLHTSVGMFSESAIVSTSIDRVCWAPSLQLHATQNRPNSSNDVVLPNNSFSKSLLLVCYWRYVPHCSCSR
jgi:hypothetical protein